MIVIKECFMTDMGERDGERCVQLINIQMPTVCICLSCEQNEGSGAFNTSFPGWSPTVPTSCCLSTCVGCLCPSMLNVLAQEMEIQKSLVAKQSGLHELVWKLLFCLKYSSYWKAILENAKILNW